MPTDTETKAFIEAYLDEDMDEAAGFGAMKDLGWSGSSQEALGEMAAAGLLDVEQVKVKTFSTGKDNPEVSFELRLRGVTKAGRTLVGRP